MSDDLVQECKGSSNWPKNLLNSSCSRSSLCDTFNRLQLNSARLFIPEDVDARVELMEVLTGKTQYTCKTWKNKFELETHYKQHLEGKEKDPLVRYLFLNAANSRARLNCTLAMFAYICTYHHIFPEFTDLAYTFGLNNTDDFSHTRFIRGDEEYQSIPELSRSHRQSRVAYKLFAMEESDFDGKWTMRQTVVYHSLDLTNGRMLWLVLKANDVIRDRIREDDVNRRRRQTGVPKNAEDALEAAFKTHITLLNWSCEGWRWFITQLEHEAQPDLNKVTAASIPPEDKALDPAPGLMETLSSPPPRIDTLSSATLPLPVTQKSSFKTGSRGTTWKSGFTIGLSLLSSHVKTNASPTASKIPTPADLVNAPEDRKAQIDQTRRRLDILRDFSLRGPQSLTAILSRVSQAKTAMTMNIRMSEDLRSYYKDLFESGQLEGATLTECSNAHRQFQWKARSLERLLEMECLRADALAEKIRSHTTLYDMILQAETREIDKLFSMSARDSTERMESSSKRMETVTERMHDIAKTTERDTSSMHIITLFTLLFLPGTFLGTFFSTPIFGDGDAEASTVAESEMDTGESTGPGAALSVVGSSWSFNWQLFWLFLKICAPMMVFTTTVWVAYMIYKTKKRARAEKAREDSERGYNHGA